MTQAQSWLVKRSGDIPQADRTFMAESRLAAPRRKHRSQGLVGVLLLSLAAGVAAWWNQDWVKLKIRDEIYALANATPLATVQERALKPGEIFKECRDCPQMIVMPAGPLHDGVARRSRR